MAVNLTLEDIKKMPTKAKVLVICVAFFLIGYLYWFYFLSSALEKKSTLNDKLTELQVKVKEKEKIAMQHSFVAIGYILALDRTEQWPGHIN